MGKKSSFKQKRLRLFVNFDFFLILLILASLFLQKYEIVIKIVAIIATIPVVISGINAVRNRRISIELLASIALIASLIEQEWLSAVFINLMITSARIFARYVEIQSHSAIEGLLKSRPLIATVERNGQVIDIPIEQVVVGDRVIAELGEKIPIDGIVEKGEAMIDQSSLTGESIPVLKKKGDKVLSFTNIVSGELTIAVEKIGKDTTFEKIIDLIESSQSAKADIETLGDVFSKWYIVFTLLGSLAVYVFTQNMTLVLSLLLVSCADDIAVAIPLALTTSIIHSAKHGAIVKGGSFIEGLSKIKVMVFDKTGTLTMGKMALAKVFPVKLTDKEVLKIAANTSLFSHHPIAKGIVEYAKNENIELEEPESVEEVLGKGLTATQKGKKVVTGKLSFLKEMQVKIDSKDEEVIKKEINNGYNVTLVGLDNVLVGFITMEDALKPNLANIIKEIKELGIEKTVMLTGDNEKIAKKISEKIGIDEFYANLLPEQKIEHLKSYMGKDYKVAMVGDGVNDAPSLALADIGIAMGAMGSDASIESSDIAMMSDDLSQIPELMKISRKTLSAIKQNIGIWAMTNIIGFILVFAFIIDPPGAATYNFLTDFIPIFNSLQLFK